MEAKELASTLHEQLAEADNKHKGELKISLDALCSELTEAKSAEIESLRIQRKFSFRRLRNYISEDLMFVR